MENQHRHIKGYRELSPEEIDLMNQIKVKGMELLTLQNALSNRLATDLEVKRDAARRSMSDTDYSEWNGGSDECVEFRRFMEAEPQRWVAIAKTDIQTGIMALVRAIAQPGGNV